MRTINKTATRMTRSGSFAVQKNPALWFITLLLVLSSNTYGQVSFMASSTSGCKPLAVNFTNTSSVGNYYVWQFGNGDSSVLANPTYVFNYSGWANVQLNAFDTTGGGMNYLGSYNLPGGISIKGSSIGASGDTACPGEIIDFYIYPSANTYSWDFGDGATSVQSSPNHTYGSPGTYTVSCIVNGYCGMETVAQNVVIMNGAFPSAQFWHPGMVCPGDSVRFDPRNREGVSYSWNFGDATTSSQVNPDHVYAAVGDYLVSMSITSTCGQTSTYSDTVHVKNNIHFGPGTSISASAQTVCPGDPVYFWYNGNALSQVWKFGTGDSSLSSSPLYSFPALGTYTVTAKLHNGCGNDTTISTVITVGSNIPFSGYAGMQINNSPSCANDLVSFDCSSASAYLWDFGDAAASTSQHTSHAYAANGTYTVTLTLYNGCGMDTVMNGTVVINNGVVPVLNHSNNNGNNNWGVGSNNATACPGDSVLFYAMGGASYLWDFGDGNTTTQTTPLNIPGQGQADLASHAYSAPGTYTVTLTYYNHCGNSATDSLIVNIGAGLPVSGGIAPIGNTFTNCSPALFLGLGGGTYKWYFGNGDSLVTTQAAVNYTYTSAGTYTATLIVTNSCANSATYTETVTINGCTGIKNTSGNESELSLYPNPNNGAFVLRGTHEGTYVLINEMGQVRRTVELNRENNFTSGVSDLENGVYFILSSLNDSPSRQKIVVIK
ncbi:MAG: PKD domain-containing protein [Bacteroidia bacterium]